MSVKGYQANNAPKLRIFSERASKRCDISSKIITFAVEKFDNANEVSHKLQSLS